MAGEARRRRLRALLRRAGLRRRIDPKALERAFVHDSAVRAERLVDPNASNQRLEFLGDAVLSLSTARWLYAKYPLDREGELTRRRAALVNDAVLAQTARRLDFGELLVLGPAEAAAGGAQRESILAASLEAFIGALYLDGGLKVAAAFIEREHLENVERSEMAAADPKTALQELLQGRGCSTPTYEDEAAGPPHRRIFTSRVIADGKLLGEGIGSSKKAAQRAAAEFALNVLSAGGENEDRS